MISYTEDIVEILNGHFSNGAEYVDSILLATYVLNIYFSNFNIQCAERVFATIGGTIYEWNEYPNSGPWGLLVRQIPNKAKLNSPYSLNITFESGDSIDIETVEGQYESVIFNFPPVGESHVMEVF